MGDLLDRGDNEVAILYWLERLQQEAADAGGELHILNGNHESLNVAGRFRYATPQGMQDFLRWQTVEKIGAGLKVGLSGLTVVAQVCLASVVHQALDMIGRRGLLEASVGDSLLHVPSRTGLLLGANSAGLAKHQCYALQLILRLQKQPAWTRSVGAGHGRSQHDHQPALLFMLCRPDVGMKTWQREGVAGGMAQILALLPGLQHSDQEVRSMQPGKLLPNVDTSGWPPWQPALPQARRPRRVSCLAAGSITRRFLAPHPTVLQIGSTLFVHGGILPEHAQYGLERINE